MKTYRLLIILLLTFSVSNFFSQLNGFVEFKNDSTTIYVKDTNDYSKSFIQEIFKFEISKNYFLNKDTLRLNSKEFALFDTGLSLNKEYHYSGQNESFKINLTIKRINFSSIQYNGEVYSGNLRNTFEGIANGGVPIFGIQNQKDPVNGEKYPYVEYLSNWVYPIHTIQIDSKNHSRIKISIGGNSTLNINEENCPTLRLN